MKKVVEYEYRPILEGVEQFCLGTNEGKYVAERTKRVWSI